MTDPTHKSLVILIVCIALLCLCISIRAGMAQRHTRRLTLEERVQALEGRVMILETQMSAMHGEVYSLGEDVKRLQRKARTP